MAYGLVRRNKRQRPVRDREAGHGVQGGRQSTEERTDREERKREEGIKR